MRSLLTIWACLLTVASALASLPVNILDSQFTTSVSLTSWYPFNTPGATRSNDVRIVVSSAPTGNTMYNYRSSGDVVADADAGLFAISAYTWLEYDGYVEASGATALSEIWFSPLSSETATLNLDFLGQYMWFYSEGFVSLTDVSTGAELWNYAWSGAVSGNVPWQVSDGTATASIMINTDFLATDTYQLRMSATTVARGDTELIQIQLSGLEPIPEPSTITIVVLAAVLVLILGRVGKCKKAVPNGCGR